MSWQVQFFVLAILLGVGDCQENATETLAYSWAQEGKQLVVQHPPGADAGVKLENMTVTLQDANGVAEVVPSDVLVKVLCSGASLGEDGTGVFRIVDSSTAVMETQSELDTIALDTLHLETLAPATVTLTIHVADLAIDVVLPVRSQPTTFTVLQYTTSMTVVEGTSFDLVILPDQVTFGGLVTIEYRGNAAIEGATTAPVSSRVIFAVTLRGTGAGDAGELFISLAKSDGLVLERSFTVTLQPPPPQQFRGSGNVQCMAGAPFKMQPLYTMYADAMGTQPVENFTASAVLSLTLSSPLYTYSTSNASSGFRNVIAILSGGNNGTEHVIQSEKGVFRAEGLAIDRPGSYEITATMTISGTIFIAVEAFYCHPAPTYIAPMNSKVNTLTTVLLYSELPFSAEGALFVSNSLSCSIQMTSRSLYPPEPVSPDLVYNSTADVASIYNELVPIADNSSRGYYYVMNVGLYPFDASDTSYVCLQVDWATGAVPLWQRYVQRHQEAYPLVFTFSIAPQSICKQVTMLEALQYQQADPPLQWLTVHAGRRYGCKQSPPVNGAVPPCHCPTTFICVDFIAEQNSEEINVGVCECCSVWFLAVMWGTGGFIFFALSYFVLFKL